MADGASITEALAMAIRGMPDSQLAEAARRLDDKSLVTLMYNMQRHEFDAHHLRPNATKQALHIVSNDKLDRVYQAVVRNPGLGRYDLSGKLDCAAATGLASSLRKLVKAGFIRREGNTSASRYFHTLRAVDEETG